MSILSSHGHALKIQPRHHTSFAALAFFLMLVGVLLMSSSLSSQAESSSLSLRVDGPPPAQSAFITKPLDGQHFTAAPTAVSGTCLPGLLIKLYRNGFFSGSAGCLSDGTFTLESDLWKGRNDLMVKDFDGLDQEGPNSPPVTVYYDEPNIGLSPVPRSTTINTAGPSLPILIKTETPYLRGGAQGDELSWPIQISGGQSPYAISWDWGDGKTDLYSHNGSVVYTAKHAYDRPGNYIVMIKVSDAAGQKAQLQLVAIVSGPIAAATTKHYFDGYLLIAWPLWFLALLMIVSFWLGQKYKQWRSLLSNPA